MPRPAHHADDSATLFQNPWQTPEEPAGDLNTRSSSSSTNWLWGLPALLGNIPIEWAKDLAGHNQSLINVVKPDFDASDTSKDAVKATWLGHASFLVEFPVQEDSEPPIRVLFDPIFSERAGPSAWTGIRRRLPAPCSIPELPEFNFVLISHNHYDHLDLPSIQEIFRIRGTDVVFLVPLGVKSYILACGIPTDQVHELDWWDEISLPAIGSSSPELILNFVCVPAQHTSGRSVMDKCTTLWCGWAVKQLTTTATQLGARIYHAGDTGYMGTNGACPAFGEIGERCGPFDLAMLPIWRGGTLSFVSQLGLRLTHHPLLSAMHASPADAVAIHRAVRARHSLGMHFATFAGTDVEALEPIIELMQAREVAGLRDWMEIGGIGVVDVGRTVEIRPSGDE
ncbi:Metallo-hydrolase/oxidoreductase [Phellopilus nigrolimitatus]|nr:Metallo-hydrolase/oxidoreductase [Phellopilus nigrolimitatus]